MLRFAVRFVSYDKAKSIGVVIGIVVSTFLVGQQTGIFYYLTGAMSALVDNAQADLWVVDNRTTDANTLGQIDVRVGRQVASLPGVARVYPLVVAGATARFPRGKSAGLTLIGAQPPAFRGGPWNVVAGSPEALLEEGAVSVDVFDRSTLSDARMGTRFEINGRQAFIALETRGARGFGATYVATPLIVGNYFGAASFPSISRITNPVNSIFQFAAPAFAGFMFDIYGSYGTAMLIACSGALIGVVLILFCKPPKPHTDAHG